MDADQEETFLGYLHAKAASSDGHLALFTRDDLEYIALRLREQEMEQNGEERGRWVLLLTDLHSVLTQQPSRVP